MYNFTDTIAPAGDSSLPAEAMSINGVYIENEINGYRTLQVEGRELLDSEISDIQIGNSNGTRYRDKRNPSRAITVTYELQSNTPEEFRERFNKLNYILDQEEAELIFLDEPQKYFTGTKSTVDAVPAGKLNVVSQFTIHCADPYKYSVYTATATNNGESTITLTNNGTKPTPINVKATMKSDNGYIGLTLDDRFYQVGKPEEVDGETYEQTDLLFDDHLFEDKGWLLNQGVTPPVTYEQLQNGTVNYVKQYDNEGYASVNYYASGESWHGSSLTKIVPPDVNGKYPVNWRCLWRFDFNTDGAVDKGREVGHNSVTFVDQNGGIICAVVFEDNNSTLERSDMAVYVGKTRVWDTKNTTKFYVSSGGDGPCVKVEKIGNQINVGFTYADINKTFLTSSPNVELRKITWYGAAYKTYANIRNNLIRALQIRKHNVEYYADIPNYFGANDVVELKGSTNALYINDMIDLDMVDIGSQPLLLPPGTHTLGIITSDWAEVPDVEVTWKERYL